MEMDHGVSIARYCGGGYRSYTISPSVVEWNWCKRGGNDYNEHGVTRSARTLWYSAAIIGMQREYSILKQTEELFKEAERVVNS